jgi:leucyl-tRNA---protein transferase
MIFEIDCPEKMTGYELDDYLSKGWYRMWQFIFTTDLVKFEEFSYPVYWLRIALPKVNYGKSQKKIITKNNAFAVEIKTYIISSEIEELYALYKTSINFKAPDSVAGCLLNGADNNIYDTQMIEMRDGNKLIAAGYFDLGETSIAGILNFYHPHYKSNSLGKYLMLLKIDYAKKLGKEWYYPGYIAKGCSRFDYKLFPDINATEVFDRARNEWIPFSWPLLSGE